MSGGIDAVARRKAVVLANRCEALETRISALESGLQRLYGVVPPPPEPVKKEE